MSKASYTNKYTLRKKVKKKLLAKWAFHACCFCFLLIMLLAPKFNRNCFLQAHAFNYNNYGFFILVFCWQNKSQLCGNCFGKFSRSVLGSLPLTATSRWTTKLLQRVWWRSVCNGYSNEVYTNKTGEFMRRYAAIRDNKIAWNLMK